MDLMVDMNNPNVIAGMKQFENLVRKRLAKALDPATEKNKQIDLAIEKMNKKDLVDYYNTVSYGSVDDKNYFNIRSKGNVDVDNGGQVQDLQSLIGMIE